MADTTAEYASIGLNKHLWSARHSSQLCEMNKLLQVHAWLIKTRSCLLAGWHVTPCPLSSANKATELAETVAAVQAKDTGHQAAVQIHA